MNLGRAVLAVLAIATVSVSGARAQTDAPTIALKGYDVVSYFKESRASKGSPGFWQDWDGLRYHFATERHKAAFIDDPDRYLPQFRSYCTAGISAGRRVEADPTAWKIVDGKLYVFSSHAAVERVNKDPAILSRAQQAWQTMK